MYKNRKDSKGSPVSLHRSMDNASIMTQLKIHVHTRVPSLSRELTPDREEVRKQTAPLCPKVQEIK